MTFYRIFSILIKGDCMKCMHDVVSYNGVEVNAYKQLKVLGYSSDLYYNKRNLGMSPQEAFDFCITFYKKKEVYV